ncbi:hypothetical protein [Niabella beijingensis]|uniref:hypothetical protein n=1 Tax=Niabella beijingensis TaxID=2872700 RepID=UPI001CBECE6F|nr:hypothetical protein [Niabella beijingensis]MBZ4191324.1 hypothetical protein [Niabella beijingensis]
MEHFFELPLTYRGEPLTVKGRLATFAYSYKVYIIVNGRELTFEKDDEGQFRVISDQQQPEIDRQLLSTIIEALKNISAG